MTRKQTIGLLVVLLIIACLPLSQVVSPQLNEMLRVTLTVYALARGLNAVISLAQGTEVAIEPMGVGVTLTPGQILDPLNDLIEQFSWVLLVASASIGVQKIILLAGDMVLLQGALIIFIVFCILFCLPKSGNAKRQKVLLKWVIVLSILRLAVPVTALTANQMQDWLSPERQQAVQVLDSTQQEIDVLNSPESEIQTRWYQGITESLDIRKKLDNIQNKAEQGIEAAVYLLAEFLLVMLLLPLLFLFIAWQLIRKVSRL